MNPLWTQTRTTGPSRKLITYNTEKKVNEPKLDNQLYNKTTKHPIINYSYILHNNIVQHIFVNNPEMLMMNIINIRLHSNIQTFIHIYVT